MTSRTRRAFSACDRVVLRTPKAMLIVTHPGEAGVFLKDHPDAVRDLAADRTPLEFDHALRCLLQPRNQLQQSRLAAARRPDDREKFALLEIEIERSQRVDRFPSFACREDLGDTAYGYDGHAAPPKVCGLLRRLDVVRQEAGVDHLRKIDVATDRAHHFLYLDHALHALEMELPAAPIGNALGLARDEAAHRTLRATSLSRL